MNDSKSVVQLTSLLEILTTSGKTELDLDKVRELKRICKQSSDHVTAAHAWIAKQLRTKHSEVRLSCLQVIQILFEKSSCFRELLLEHFEEFLELSTGFALAKKPQKLPPPENVAKRLCSVAVDTVKRWACVFGDAYPRLEVAVRFLESQTEAQKARRSDNDADGINIASRREQMRVGALTRETTRATDQFEDRRADIEECINELRNAVVILVPTLEDFAQTGNTTADPVDLPSIGRTEVVDISSRTFPANYEIIVEIHQKSFRLRRTEDNAVVLDTLSERLKQVEQTVLPDLRKWLCSFQKCQGFDAATKQCIDYKNQLIHLQNKVSTLGVESKRRTAKSEEGQAGSTDDDYRFDSDEFVDVSGDPSSSRTKPVISGTIDRLLMETEYGMPPVMLEDVLSTTSDDTAPRASEPSVCISNSMNCILHPPTKTLSSDSKNPSSSGVASRSSGKPHANPPIIPYGVDLEYWGRENQLAVPDRVAPLDAVWSMQSGEKSTAAELVAAARTRTYAYTSEWKPVEHVCRVPLSNGKLCPRQDRLKCPLHGLIIPRDAVGEPVDPQQAASLSSCQKKGVLGHLIKKSSAQEAKPWEDAELLRDIEAQTGVTMTTAASRKRGAKAVRSGWHMRRKPHSNLTDISAAKKTVTKRLERKLFDTKTVKRVGEQLDREMRKRNDEKFQHQWNYS